MELDKPELLSSNLTLCQGLPVPIFGSMAETASLFLAYSQIQSLIKWSTNTSQSNPLTLPQLGLAAGGAGFLTSFILSVCRCTSHARAFLHFY